jgi:hypothetical protein
MRFAEEGAAFLTRVLADGRPEIRDVNSSKGRAGSPTRKGRFDSGSLTEGVVATGAGSTPGCGAGRQMVRTPVSVTWPAVLSRQTKAGVLTKGRCASSLVRTELEHHEVGRAADEHARPRLMARGAATPGKSEPISRRACHRARGDEEPGAESGRAIRISGCAPQRGEELKMNTTAVKYTDPATGHEYEARVQHDADWTGVALLTVDKTANWHYTQVLKLPAPLIRTLAREIERGGR